MTKKSIFLSIIPIFIFSILFGYSLVFAGVFNSDIKMVFKTSNNIYLDSLKLKNIDIVFESNKNLEEYKIKSQCNIFSKMIKNTNNLYVFKLKFFDNKCTNNNFILVNDKDEVVYRFKLKTVTEYLILSKLLDLKTDDLKNIQNKLSESINNNYKYLKYDKNIQSDIYKYIKKNRFLKEQLYQKKIIENILKKRNEKYLIPVIGGKIDLKPSKIPNAGRPYRAQYTDGIHHGWDVAGDFEEQVIALDDGIIVRVVSEFDYSDLNSIKKGKNISNYDKIRNLDILRGKQVWIKTMSGDVVFYSHLTDVYTNITVGTVVRKKQPIGTIGITGVPDKDYDDYHLHFVIHKNPFLKKFIGKYDIDDYMKWDWSFKGKSKKYIIENYINYFE